VLLYAQAILVSTLNTVAMKILLHRQVNVDMGREEMSEGGSGHVKKMS
jgi:hypothetical protein